MASVKLFADKEDTKKDGKVKVYILLIHKGDPAYIPLDIFVTSAAFNFIKWECTPAHDLQHAYNAKLQAKLSVANQALLDLADRDFTLSALRDHIKSMLKSGGKPLSIQNVADTVIGEKSGPHGEMIRKIVRYFITWLGGDQQINTIGFEGMNKYKVYLRATGVSESTVKTYLSHLQPVFTYAEKTNVITAAQNPFNEEGIIPEAEETKKRNIGIEKVSELEDITPGLPTRLRHYAETALLQFYMQGIDFEDIDIPLKKDIPVRRYIFKRYKTRSRVKQPEVPVYLIDKAMAIINSHDRDKLIPIYNKRGNYHALLQKYNRNLKTLSAILDLPKEKYMTSKTMRHTWLSVAANLKPAVLYEVRQKCVGHKIKGSTDIYTEYDISIIDEANARVTDTSHFKNTNDGQTIIKRTGTGKARSKQTGERKVGQGNRKVEEIHS